MAVTRAVGVVVFFTGLSGAGKTTLAQALTQMLQEKGRSVTILDGDVMRRNLSRGLGFSREDRDANIERIGFVAAEIARHGGIAVCAAIAPYAASRERNRAAAVAAGGSYVEVYVSTPLAVCEARDVKGLYEKARRGELKQFTGVDDPYEPPASPDLAIDAGTVDPLEAAQRILAELAARGIV